MTKYDQLWPIMIKLRHRFEPFYFVFSEHPKGHFGIVCASWTAQMLIECVIRKEFTEKQHMIIVKVFSSSGWIVLGALKSA